MPRAAAPRRRLDAPAAAGAWVLAAGVAAWSLWHYLHPLTAGRLADLDVYRTAILAARHGASLYAFHSARGAGFTYPPFAAIVLTPLALLPDRAAEVGWSLLTVAAVVWLARAVAAALPDRLRVAWAWPLLTAVALATKPVQSDLRFGQVSILLAAALLADALTLDGHRGQGVLTGLAAAVKLTPLIFVPYLWLTGRRRAAWVSLAVFAGAGALAVALWPADSVRFWAHHLLHDTSGLPLSEGGNQSVYAVALRAGAHGGWLAAVWLWLAVVVGVACLWRARAAWRGGQRLLSVAIAGCGSILVSPISWLHTQIWILVAAAGVESVPWAIALAVPMLIGLPGVAALGPPGRWLATNHRAVLALLVVCAVPAGRSAVRLRRQVAAAGGDGQLAGGAEGALRGVPGGG